MSSHHVSDYCIPTPSASARLARARSPLYAAHNADPRPQTQGEAWFKPSEENVYSGVCLRVGGGRFRVFPYDNAYLEPFEAAVRALNPVVAVKIRSAAIHAALATV